VEWNIGKIPKKWSILTPDKAAIIYDDEMITYKQINDGANRAANYLQQMGLKKGDRITVLLKDCPEFMEVYFAAAKLGLIFVPLNFRFMGPEVKYQLNNSGSRVLVFHDIMTEMIDSIRSEVAVDKDKFIYLPSSFSDEAPECPAWAENYHDLIKQYSTEEPHIDNPVELDDPLVILYTSGTTGEPKGALMSHGQTYFKNAQNIFYTDMRVDDIYLSQLPLFHSGGLFVAVTPTLCRGATMVMRQKFDPAKFVSDIERYKPTIVFALTSMWRLILQTKTLDGADVSSVRNVIGGGERTPKSLFDELAAHGLYMQQVFGQTENSIMMVLPKKDVQRKMGSIGIPGFFTEVWIGDEQGRELPHGTTGEIVAKGPNVMMKYWNMPERTAETIKNGILFTGDLGYRDDEGYFYIVDRAKDMYRSGGENVYPAEIEKVLADHPRILNVAIIGVPDDKWGETGMAFIVLKEGETLTKDEILEFLNGKLARFKLPSHIKFIGELPMTTSGKIKKVELKEKYGATLETQ
jgi:fatty-acyl-CoA synthase